MKIIINFKQPIGDINITIDNAPVTFERIGTVATIDYDTNHGLHYMEFVGDQMHEIESITVDECSLRDTLYMGWGTRVQERIQPCTHFNDTIKLVLPFGYPVSWWLGEVSRNIDFTDYGKDLSEKYDLFWPNTMTIDPEFPKLIREFFYYNHGFTAVPHRRKQYKNDLPYRVVDVTYDPTEILKEVTANPDLWKQHYFNPGSTQHDKIETNKQVYWEKINVFLEEDGGWLLKDDEFPVLREFLNNLPVHRLIYAFIAKLEPDTYISPHCDRNYLDPDKYGSGCTQLYCPLTWDEGNFFRMQNVGNIPVVAGQAVLVNVFNYQHSLINQSNTDRYIIQTVVDLTGTPWEP